METGKSRPNVDFGSDSKGGVSVSLLDKSWYNDVTVSGTLTDEEVHYFKDLLGGSLPTPGSPLDKALVPSIPPQSLKKPGVYEFGSLVTTDPSHIESFILPADRTPLDELAELVPALKSQHVRHPEVPPTGSACAGQVGALKTIGYMIVHLNDRHQWPREQIADWLDSLENVDLTIQSASSGD
jgi:hypothetical protein